jgi:hypothetical protein
MKVGVAASTAADERCSDGLRDAWQTRRRRWSNNCAGCNRTLDLAVLLRKPLKGPCSLAQPPKEIASHGGQSHLRGPILGDWTYGASRRDDVKLAQHF